MTSQGRIYGAMNNVTGKWYIGSTKNSLDMRRHQHYFEALKPNSKTRHLKFASALIESEEADWIWGEHEVFENISERDLRIQEGAYQEAFNSIDDGYNMVPAAVSVVMSETFKARRDHRQNNNTHESEEEKQQRLRYNAYQREGNAKRKAKDPEAHRLKMHEAYMKYRNKPGNAEKIRERNNGYYAKKNCSVHIENVLAT